MSMLEYETEMFLEILHEDGLVVAAKGLSIETVFANIMRAYSDPNFLVLVLGTTDHEEKYFIEKLHILGVSQLPRVITSQCLSDERERIYLEGGVLFVSGRILVVDLLKNRVPLNLVSGILVYRAHNILNLYQEAFALRLYRQTNKTGFIKAFTSSALAFTIGFCQVERVMRTLFVTKLYLWPRFHSTVKSSLSKREPEVVELHVPLTSKMLSIQTALLDVMNFMVKELKKNNKYLELDELTVENAVAKKFHKLLQQQLDPIWHQLSQKTKQLIADLKTLRSLLMCLTHEDAVSFYAMLNSLRTMDYAVKSSGWLVLDVVENMFKAAKARVYNDKNELKPEANPKWEALSEILSEIHRADAKTRKENDPTPKILIFTQDYSMCTQVKNFLTLGGEEYLRRTASRKFKNKNQPAKKPNSNAETKGAQNKEESSEADEENKDEEEQLESYVLTLTQKPKEDNEKDSEELLYQSQFEHCSQITEMDLTTIATEAPIVVVQSLKKGGDSMALQRILSEVLPSFVVLYTADISTVRQLEKIYQNRNVSLPLTVYFLIYGGSVEEQAYLTSLRREKAAFEKLINAKKTMVVPVDQDGKSVDATAFSEPSISSEEPVSSRKGGIQDESTKLVEKVIVDMREFRSELPALLHKRGIEIEPVTLVVGDYILSPEICVERKSISDLIGSLNSGRLYNQAISMTRYYSKPMLLIEFDQNKPFCFQGNYYVSKDMKSSEITSKLQLLTIHFPKLKLVWSPSPHATAQLFEELKQGRQQPDALKAAQVGTDGDSDDKTMAEKYNCNIQDFVAKLPGVHTKNLRVVLNRGHSLDHLILLSQDELVEFLGNKSDAQLLYRALHEKTKPDPQPSTSTSGKTFSKTKSRGLFFKKK
ncbi:DNA repair endonuclease XPF isoform X1 [Belonocnema kinseyi]|uniref:DNA repair endonuclease XPF isoform X1 n=1 Tax=Belonocnema kinseyi TaxID=2817044 RepID=UPI00143D4138|nr:DNA repair endonuclease XPF isoform X1 [Belonocnema kinseyi]